MNDQSYKDTPEGRKTAQLYGDIIHILRPASRRPHMDLIQRAKIFAPYDALRGFDEAIEAVNETKTEVSRKELSEEQKAALSDQLLQVRKGILLSVTCFVPESSAQKGRYMTLTGTVERIDPIARTLSIREHTKSSASAWQTDAEQFEKVLPVIIRFDDLLQLSITEGVRSPSTAP